MAAQNLLQFDFMGAPLAFPTVELGTAPSPFSGRELRRLRTEVTVSPQEAALVKDFLATAPLTDSEGALWSGNLDMESYANNGPHSLTITWSEVEHLRRNRWPQKSSNGSVLPPTPLVLTAAMSSSRTLNDEGRATKRGGQWQAMSVRSVLRSAERCSPHNLLASKSEQRRNGA